MRGEVVVAADVGGSSTRVVACDRTGRVLSRVRAAGANPNAVGLGTSAAMIRGALDQALADAGSSTPPVAVVVGLAGGSRITSDRTFLGAITPNGSSTPRISSDLAVAFSSATPLQHGCVLVAGTGAVAGRIAAGELVDQRDGWGWLLGDAGAGFWIGRELVRSTLRRLERRQPPDALDQAVLDAAAARDRTGLVQACYAQPPIWLASLASLISEHPEEPAAIRVADQATHHLVELLIELQPISDGPVVLAGSVATSPGPVATLLRRRLVEDLDVDPLLARSGTIGAAWTALRLVGVADPAIHAHLVAQLADD